MARTRSLRFNLWRWSDDGDEQQRSDFDDSAAEIEARGAKYGQGTLAGKGAAAAANRGTFWIVDDAAGGGTLGEVYYSDGATWARIGPGAGVGGAAPTTTQPGDVPAEGASIAAARRDHLHGNRTPFAELYLHGGA